MTRIGHSNILVSDRIGHSNSLVSDRVGHSDIFVCDMFSFGFNVYLSKIDD